MEALQGYIRTVEERIVCQPYAAAQQQKCCSSAKGAFWSTPAGSSESLAPGRKLPLQPAPGFLWIWGSHHSRTCWVVGRGGEVVVVLGCERAGGGDGDERRCRARSDKSLWSSEARVADAKTRLHLAFRGSLWRGRGRRCFLLDDIGQRAFGGAVSPLWTP